MLASAVPSSFCGQVVDLGAGAGGAGLAVLSRCPKAKALLVERSHEMVLWAHRSLALEDNASLRNRVEIIEADVSLTGQTRRMAGLADNSADFAILNPPFNLEPDRSSPDPLRKEAHVMVQGLFEQWLRTAAAMVRPKGGVAIIARPQSLADILSGLAGRFGNAEIVPVLPRPDKPAIRIIMRAVRASRAGLTLHPPLIVHDLSGRGFTERAEAINNGQMSLFGD